MKVKSTMTYNGEPIAECEWELDDRARTAQQALAAIGIEDHLRAQLKIEHKIITDEPEPEPELEPEPEPKKKKKKRKKTKARLKMSRVHTVKIVVKEDSHSIAPYKIKQVENSTEWKIGQRLTRIQVDEILDRYPPYDVKVLIK